MVLTYEFDMNMYVINRDTYTLLDWLGDIGGLGEGLAIIFGAIIALFNYNTFEDHLVRQLYRKETQKDRLSRKSGLTNDEGNLKLVKGEGIKLEHHESNCLMRRLRDFGLMKSCGRQFKKKKNDMYYERGRELLG